MEGAKIKNIVLLILLVVNVFLLVQVADQERQSALHEEQTRAGAVEVLARQNIAVRMESLPEERGIPPWDIPQRDKAGEEALAAGLLGQAEAVTEQGGPSVYLSKAGEGYFFSNGRFYFNFSGGIPLDGEEPERHAVRLMKAAGYDAVFLESVRDPADGGLQVVLRQLWAGEEVFNCGATLTYLDGALRSVEGHRLFGVPTEGEAVQGLSVATVLIRFLGGIREGGYLCSEVRDLRPGYEMTMEASGSGKLIPVWLVVTDGGSFYVNGTDGTLSVADAKEIKRPPGG